MAKVMPFSELANFTPKQLEAERISDNHKYFLFGGAKYGTKSYFLRWRLLRLILKAAQMGFRNVKAALFCEDYPTLKDRQVCKIEVEFPSWMGTLSNSQTDGLSYKLRPEYGNGALHLRNLDDPSKYDSVEYAFIGVDELTKNKQSKFTQLRSILRWNGIDWCKFIAGTNPGGIGHSWVKNKFIDKKHEPEEQEANQFAFLQSLIKDNPYKTEEYEKQLQSLPDKLKRAYLYGDWDVFEGQFFAEWDRQIHVIPYFYPLGMRKYLCMDWGYDAPSAIYWVGIDYDRRRIHYRELYKNGLTPEALAQQIADMTNKDEINDLIAMYCDPSIWSEEAGNMSIAKRMEKKLKEIGFRIKLIPASNDREAGALQMHELLKPYMGLDGKWTAKMLWTENCLKAIETIPMLEHDKTNPEKYSTKGADHAADSCRYGLSCETAPKMPIRDIMQTIVKSPSLTSVGAYW